MDFVERTIKESIEHADGERIISIYALRETFKRSLSVSLTPRFKQACNAGMISGMMYEYDKIADVNAALNDLTEEEHAQLWIFILDQTENLKDKIPEEHQENMNTYLTKIKEVNL